MNLDLKIPLCIFDLETTGTNPSTDRIIEIAVVKLLPGGERLYKSHLINPTIPIPPESSAIHGIRDEDVAARPTFKLVAREYAQFFEGADIAGFNVIKFDLPVLVEEFLRAEVDFDYGRKRIIDAQRIYHLMEKRTLSAAYKFYCDRELENSHSAMADTQATLEVLLAQVQRYHGQQVTDALGNKIGKITSSPDSLAALSEMNMIDLAGRMIRDAKGQAIFNFGKHKGKAVLQVLTEEPAFYDWMMRGDFALDTKRKLTELRLSSLKL